MFSYFSCFLHRSFQACLFQTALFCMGSLNESQSTVSDHSWISYNHSIFLVQPFPNKPHALARGQETTFHGGKAGHVKGTCRSGRERHVSTTVVIPAEESFTEKFLKYL